jgi:hypothetical protein
MEILLLLAAFVAFDVLRVALMGLARRFKSLTPTLSTHRHVLHD